MKQVDGVDDLVFQNLQNRRHMLKSLLPKEKIFLQPLLIVDYTTNSTVDLKYLTCEITHQ